MWRYSMPRSSWKVYFLRKLALQTLWLPPHIMRDAVIQQLQHDVRTFVLQEHGQNFDHVVMAESLLNRNGGKTFLESI